LLAAIKQTQLFIDAGNDSYRALQVDYNILFHEQPLASDITMCQVHLADGTTMKAIKETKTFILEALETAIAEQLLHRLRNVVKLVNTARHPESLCHGFYFDKTSCSVGLVYKFPPLETAVTGEGDGQGEHMATILGSVLSKAHGHPPSRLLLGMRFKLAHSIAASVLEFNKVSWLQKNILPFNLLFFHPRNEAGTDHVGNWC
jgi:hypothetical protein